MSEKRSNWPSLNAVTLVGTHVPRRCGIGTFSSDLSESLAAVAPHIDTRALAMNDRPEGYRYPPRVWFEINQQRLPEYRLAADFLNMSGIDVCSIQHEFGIYGGDCGQHLLELIRRLRMPVVTTLHTVLAEPSDKQREITEQLADRSERLIVMAERARQFLVEVYGIDEEKVTLIHHGIPDVPFVDPNFYKDQFGVEGRKVLLTFGLLSPNKGIEQMIEAMPAIAEKHPEVVYIVLGATHPGVMAHQGEEYRLGLKRRARELGVEQHVEFINKFVEFDELVEFLGAADIYVTPYRGEAQIVSGTLAYALGAGKAIVSTPYWYAQEMLAEERGKLVPFDDPPALAEAVNHLLENETQRHTMRKRAYQYARQMRWDAVARQYLDVFEHVRQHRNQTPRPVMPRGELRRKDLQLTEVKLDHLQMLTDDTGIFCHAKSTVPDRAQGYSSDDAARGLIVTLMAQDHLSDTHTRVNLDELAGRYLSFLDYAYHAQAGRFRSRLSFDRQWRDEVGSEQTHGRALWALGEVVARSNVRGHMTMALNLFQRALPACETMQSMHGLAYNLIAIHAYLRRFSGDSHARRLREQLALRLFEAFEANASDDWPWPVDELTEANARLPQALLLAGRWLFHDAMIQQALTSLHWLVDVQTGDAGQFAPIGSRGGLVRGQTKARFEQRPIEAAAMIDACLEAHRVTAQERWADHADRCMEWFLGDNDLHLPLYDQTTGGCSDALTAEGLNQNQGAEATLSWLLSLLAQYEHNLELARPGATGHSAAASALERQTVDGSNLVKPRASKLPS
jgi:glycosyltransferase involved in cell wall biosynthesis